MEEEVKTIILRDDTPFTINNSVRMREHCLYYGDSKLTDKSAIKNVHVYENGEIYNTGRHTIYCLGEIKQGEYLTTCKMYGVATKIINKDFAFAQAISDKEDTKRRVGLVDVVFL